MPTLVMGRGRTYELSDTLIDELDADNPSETDFRFSASVASRYHNCHGSANLTEAIEGFEYPPRNENGMKGEGTRLHKIFEEALSDVSNLRDKAKLLRLIVSIHWVERRKILEDAKTFIVWWFMQFKTAPPLSHAVIYQALMHKKRAIDENGNEKIDAEGNEVWVIAGAPPRRLQFLADALERVADIIDEMEAAGADDIEVLSEVKKAATWLETAPKTTVDLIIRSKKLGRMEVIDLKMGEIEVSPIENEQLMYYAVTFSAHLYAKVRLHIMQRNNIDYWDVSQEKLTAWKEDMQSSEDKILGGDLTLTPGEHCKFCPANPHSRSDRGSKACPVMMTVLYGARDDAATDSSMEGDDLD